MKTSARNSPFRRRSQRGFSLIETVISSFFVGVLLVAALRTVDASVQTQQQMARGVTATMLADSLMSEILAKKRVLSSRMASRITERLALSPTDRQRFLSLLAAPLSAPHPRSAPVSASLVTG